MQIPGIQVHTMSYNKSIYTQCDIVEDEPVFVISHDDVYNLGISYSYYTHIYIIRHLMFHPS